MHARSESVEGTAGILSTMSPAADVAKASAGLGSRWETMEVAVKPYPSCRYSHAALDGAKNAPLFAMPFIYYKNDHFTKTDSGQT